MPHLPKSKRLSWMPKKEVGQSRQFNNSKFYNSKQWKMTRKFYIKQHPLCEQCKRNKTIKGGDCVDHIKPITTGGAMVDFSNLQTLCNSCHAKKSANESVEYRRGIKIYERKDK